MGSILINKNVIGVKEIKDGDDSCVRKPVFRKALAPVVCFMKIFGLYYDLQKDSSKKNREWELAKIYCSVIMLLLVTELIRVIVGFFYLTDKDDVFVSVMILVYTMKSVFQMMACRKLSPSYCACRLKEFIEKLERFLSDIKLSNCSSREKYFAKKIRIWLYVFIISSLGLTLGHIGIIVNYDYNSKNINATSKFDQLFSFQAQIMKPYPMRLNTMLGLLLVSCFNYAAWFLPVAMCGIMSECISYTYSEFYRFFKSIKNDAKNNGSLCVKKYVKILRKDCVILSSFVKELDDIVKYIYLVSFPLDIVLICVNLQIAIYSVTDTLARLYILLWTCSPIFTLIAISLYSAQIASKGEEMHDIVQDFVVEQANLDAQVEVQLLLFHLQTQPAVMTIYGMVPLYKSIIVSIFVSVATYFSLIISF